MPVDPNRHIYEGLTRWNYLPNQKAPIGEMPPSISSRQFTPEVADLLAAVRDSENRRNARFDDVSYLMTRHDNVPRQLGLIHPTPYARLARRMWLHWNELGALAHSENSAIKPDFHEDGRIFIMNYEDALTKTTLAVEASFAKRFRVETDIAGCFNSIYSHSIPWAIVGFDVEKARVRENGPPHWSNGIDTMQRGARRGETVGLAIGPATSSIIVEAILGRVDAKMREAGFEFRRYIDDYICYCDTHEQAQQFLTHLGKQLVAYRLHLNLQKTVIVELPEPPTEPWVTALGTALEGRLVRREGAVANIYMTDAVQYLDFATRLNRETRDGSVLKYAVGSLLPHLDQGSLANIAGYLINLAWHYPALLPYLEKLCGDDQNLLTPYEAQLNAIIIENAKHRRSDGMAWPLHLMRRSGLQLSKYAIESVLGSEDCISCTLLFEFHQADDALVARGKELLARGHHERDQQWLLLYQLALHKAIDVHDDEPGFEILRQREVNFVPDADSETQAEKYCDYLNNPFMGEDEVIVPLDEWVAQEEARNANRAQRAANPLDGAGRE